MCKRLTSQHMGRCHRRALWGVWASAAHVAAATHVCIYIYIYIRIFAVWFSVVLVVICTKRCHLPPLTKSTVSVLMHLEGVQADALANGFADTQLDDLSTFVPMSTLFSWRGRPESGPWSEQKSCRNCRSNGWEMLSGLPFRRHF